MQFANFLLLGAVVFTAACIGVGVAQGSTGFDSIQVSAGCSARTVTVSARGEIECAAAAAQYRSYRSFSFTNGVCVLSDSLDCAAPGTSSIFMRRSQHPGYEQLIGARRFWVFQQRLAGRVVFNRTWVEYEDGFGEGSDNAATEFWSGLPWINVFTKSHTNVLRIETTTVDGATYVAEWLNFIVAGVSTNYTMTCGAYVSGSSNFSGDAMDWSRNQAFSTIDADNDVATKSCSNEYGGGGFWYSGCFHINPNGQYSSTLQTGADRIAFLCSDYVESLKTLRFMRMMLQM